MNRRSFVQMLGIASFETLFKSAFLSGNSNSIAQHADKSSRVFSGIDSLDKLKGGFYPGEICIISSRPSIGKTSVAVDMTRHAALVQNKRVAFYSIELSRETLVKRMICAETRISYGKLMEGGLEAEDIHRLAIAAEKIAHSKIYISDNSECSIEDIDRDIAELNKKERIDLIVIDYLQLMTKIGKASPAAQLKSLAMKYSVPIIALSQLKRSAEGRADVLPIEEIYFDTAINLFRKGYYERPRPPMDLLELHLLKNRSGQRGLALTSWSTKSGWMI